MSLLTSLAGPVLGLVGKLFGSKKKEETVNRVDYARMVADAEAAGFNPLTALRNGGSAGFSVTSHPVLSSREVIGQAMGEVGNFLSNFDPFADQKREAEFNLVQAQIRNLNASSDALTRSQSFNVPSYSAGAVERRPSGSSGQLSGVLLPAFGSDVPAAEDADKMVNPFPVGSGIEIPGYLKSADAWENVMGEPGQWVGGLYNANEILYHNFKRKMDEVRAKPPRLLPAMRRNATSWFN